MKQHPIVFFDHYCSLCKKCVYYLLLLDNKKILRFAPLSGHTADKVLVKDKAYFKKSNTLVLVERRKEPVVRVRACAIFRVLWLLGGIYRLSIVLWPLQPVFQLLYRIVARYRHLLFQSKKNIDLSKYQDRFFS